MSNGGIALIVYKLHSIFHPRLVKHRHQMSVFRYFRGQYEARVFCLSMPSYYGLSQYAHLTFLLILPNTGKIYTL
jgi:hypothetical protein